MAASRKVQGKAIVPATAAVPGSMSAADKAKLDSMTAGAAVASVGATAPITSSGGVTPTIAITAATGVAAGSMSAADKAKLDGVAAGADVTADALVAAGTTTTDVAATANKKRLVALDLGTIATATAQFQSLADALFTGIVAGGRATGTTGTLGAVAGSFGSSGAETGTGAGQGGLSSAANADQPYNAADFPGGRFRAGLFHPIGTAKAGEPIVLLDVLSTAPVGSLAAPVFFYLSFRSDLGANLKWRGCFYYTSETTGLDTPFVPNASVSAQLTVPVVYQEKDVPTAAGYVPIASPGAAELIAGAAGDIANVTKAAAAAGASGKYADAAHKHDVTTAAPSTALSGSSTNSEGAATSLARSDHGHQISEATATVAGLLSASDKAKLDTLDAGILRVRLVTNIALAAYTYANGAAGDGATITINAVGALANIDGETPAVSDRILVTTGAALTDNGVYDVTVAGDGGTAAVLTRSTLANTPAKLAGLQVEVLAGNSAKSGAPVFACINPASAITIGTTGLVFLRVSVGGSPRLTYKWFSDFDIQVATLATGLNVPGTGMYSSIANSGTIAFNSTNAGNSLTEIGIATLGTGTASAAGLAAISGLGAGAFKWDTNAAIWMSIKFKQAALSTAAQKAETHLGCVSAAYASGVYVSCDADADTHIRLVVKSATAGGTTTQASTVTENAGQFYHVLIWKDAGSNQIHWAIDGVRQTDPATTNTPISDLIGPYLDIGKSNGTGTARSVDLDWFEGQYFYPLGRAA